MAPHPIVGPLRQPRGLTLIEFIIVVMVIGILSVMAMPQWPGSTITLSAQADLLVSDLLYTQMLSVTTGTRYRLSIINSNSYQIVDSAGNAIIYPGTGNTTIALHSDITFGTRAYLPNNMVTFDGKGSPYVDALTPGTPLTATATIPLIAGTLTKIVAITPITGWIYQQ